MKYQFLFSKTLFASSIVFTTLLLAHPIRADDQSSGCGLGYQVTKRNSLLSSAARSMTNGTFSNTIAMTSGTSGCAQHSIVLREHLPVHFAESNLPQIELEMAVGKGEFLEAFALSLGCSAEALPEFYRFSRSNYSSFMGNATQTAAQRVQTIRQALQSSSALKNACPGRILG